MQWNPSPQKWQKSTTENNILEDSKKLNILQLKALFRHLQKGTAMKNSKYKLPFEFSGFKHTRLRHIKKDFRVSLIERLFSYFNGVVSQEGYECFPAMPYDEWKKTNLGYERLVERCYQQTYSGLAEVGEYYTSIRRIQNMIIELIK